MVTDTKNDKDQQPAEEIVGTVVYIETEFEIPGWIGRGGGRVASLSHVIKS